eukprot:GFYU01003597.1.p1 GENE.GFYU01003597.1~~GFYU01003597.1.p1  ORF type:complete len:234 (-),score=60.51 GFYU01003597.1:221-922(-)
MGKLKGQCQAGVGSMGAVEEILVDDSEHYGHTATSSDRLRTVTDEATSTSALVYSPPVDSDSDDGQLSDGTGVTRATEQPFFKQISKQTDWLQVNESSDITESLAYTPTYFEHIEKVLAVYKSEPALAAETSAITAFVQNMTLSDVTAESESGTDEWRVDPNANIALHSPSSSSAEESPRAIATTSYLRRTGAVDVTEVDCRQLVESRNMRTQMYLQHRALTAHEFIKETSSK